MSHSTEMLLAARLVLTEYGQQGMGPEILIASEQNMENFAVALTQRKPEQLRKNCPPTFLNSLAGHHSVLLRLLRILNNLYLSKKVVDLDLQDSPEAAEHDILRGNVSSQNSAHQEATSTIAQITSITLRSRGTSDSERWSVRIAEIKKQQFL